MRLFLLPISTRRSLIYCERLQVHEKALAERSYLDRITNKAATTWLSWEKDDKAVWQWKRKVTFYGNQALSRIPYEEWALKTIPALTDKRRKAILEGKEKNQIVFPGLFLKQDKIPEILKKLAEERQAMHRSKMIWSIVAMPFSAPFMLIPVIPNLPFFYLVYRAYSHWKALSGSKHLEFLLKHSLPAPKPSWELDEIYTAGLMYPTRQLSRAAPRPTTEQAEEIARVVETQTDGGKEDVMVLQRWNGKLIAEHYALPDMEVEIERAVEQVEKSIKAKERLVEEKLELERATAEPGKTAADTLPEEVVKHVEKGERADRIIHEKAEDVAGLGNGGVERLEKEKEKK
ncbi:hypothetical protein P154DRAFT_519084 [Amniculicola lignicola CBS 123094]|uniref:Mitochondrial K+-H+ exchange-related-domain-containing protein n=1 Tax=Amniculicola lignicola CBS 123094 TaxID=1392246 RepID=A0A6A5WRU9_9PLEO|nr:hypothetical protein P154DRAFT_519084 [Amniculicola lignicola CBS 123094]